MVLDMKNFIDSDYKHFEFIRLVRAIESNIENLRLMEKVGRLPATGNQAYDDVIKSQLRQLKELMTDSKP